MTLGVSSTPVPSATMKGTWLGMTEDQEQLGSLGLRMTNLLELE